MPSQDTKRVKNEDLDGDDECLGSMLRDKANQPAPSGSLNSKALPNVKKEEAQDSGTPLKKLVNSSSKSVKVTKSVKAESDSDDDKPIFKKSVSKSTKTPNVKKEDLTPVKKPVNTSSKSVKVKKVEKFEFDSDDEDKPISRKSVSKDTKKTTIQVKKKTKSQVEESNTKKREKKVYDLPGQKRDPPEERDPLRIFYESLYEQVPESEMAAIWMMESGLLPREVAAKVLERKKKNPLQKVGSPVKKVITTTKKSAESASKSTTVKVTKSVTSNTPNTSNKKNETSLGSTINKSKKRKKSESSSEEDSDDDFVISKAVKKQKAR